MPSVLVIKLRHEAPLMIITVASWILLSRDRSQYGGSLQGRQDYPLTSTLSIAAARQAAPGAAH